MARADIADAMNVTDEVDETTDTISGTNPMEYIARFREQSMRISQQAHRALNILEDLKKDPNDEMSHSLVRQFKDDIKEAQQNLKQCRRITKFNQSLLENVLSSKTKTPDKLNQVLADLRIQQRIAAQMTRTGVETLKMLQKHYIKLSDPKKAVSRKKRTKAAKLYKKKATKNDPKLKALLELQTMQRRASEVNPNLNNLRRSVAFEVSDPNAVENSLAMKRSSMIYDGINNNQNNDIFEKKFDLKGLNGQKQILKVAPNTKRVLYCFCYEDMKGLCIRWKPYHATADVGSWIYKIDGQAVFGFAEKHLKEKLNTIKKRSSVMMGLGLMISDIDEFLDDEEDDDGTSFKRSSNKSPARSKDASKHKTSLLEVQQDLDAISIANLLSTANLPVKIELKSKPLVETEMQKFTKYVRIEVGSFEDITIDDFIPINWNLYQQGGVSDSDVISQNESDIKQDLSNALLKICTLKTKYKLRFIDVLKNLNVNINDKDTLVPFAFKEEMKRVCNLNESEIMAVFANCHIALTDDYIDIVHFDKNVSQMIAIYMTKHKSEIAMQIRKSNQSNAGASKSFSSTKKSLNKIENENENEIEQALASNNEHDDAIILELRAKHFDSAMKQIFMQLTKQGLSINELLHAINPKHKIVVTKANILSGLYSIGVVLTPILVTYVHEYLFQTAAFSLNDLIGDMDDDQNDDKLTISERTFIPWKLAKYRLLFRFNRINHASKYFTQCVKSQHFISKSNETKYDDDSHIESLTLFFSQINQKGIDVTDIFLNGDTNVFGKMTKQVFVEALLGLKFQLNEKQGMQVAETLDFDGYGLLDFDKSMSYSDICFCSYVA